MRDRTAAKLATSAAVLALAMLAGCASDKYPVPPIPPREDAPAYYAPPVEGEYKMQVGDAVAIRSYFDAQLNQDAVVRPDGRITALLVGDVPVAGMTTTDLANHLRGQYRRLIGDTDISVALTHGAGLSVFLTGEVKVPSLLPLDGNITLLQAITRAGGFLSTANTGYVLLIRNNVDGTLTVLKVDTDRILAGEAQDVYLQRRDVVFVPKSDIAQVNQFVDQYINNIVPRFVQVQLGWFNTRTTNRNSAIQVSP